MCPKDDWKIDCYVDADFCGLWGSEDPEDPVVAKSRTGYILTLAGCPLMWVFKLQTEVSVSTMMAEYVALYCHKRHAPFEATCEDRCQSGNWQG